MSPKPQILLMGQTPPPWHGQAVATQILFDHDWPEFEVHRLRMEYSGDMDEVGRFQLRKLKHLWDLIRKSRRILKTHPDCVLLYPPSSAKWIPFLRDVVFLNAVRHLAGKTVFIYHASGLPVFADQNWLTRLLSYRIYHGADVSLEVAREAVPPHRVFEAWESSWCPCAIEIGQAKRTRPDGGPLVAVYVGSLQEGKGILEILRTANAIKEQGLGNDFHFRIVGKWFSAEFEKEARRMHEELGLGKLVEFVGQLTGDEKWQAYADADVFFFPTHYASEATPIVIMEALGMGLPVLSTQWAGIPAMLEGCNAATLLPIRDPEAYADALISMAATSTERRESRDNAISFYQKHFLPERFIERVTNAFHAALDIAAGGVASPQAPSTKHPAQTTISIYLADQNPKLGRSLGISRMTEVVIDELHKRSELALSAVVSQSSVHTPEGIPSQRLPWPTRSAAMRVVTDHLHPLLRPDDLPDLFYFPKGYLPGLSALCSPSVVTIHDTIVQHYADHYPKWRTRIEYGYWAMMLKHTLRNADYILTVSQSSKRQILDFMERHGIPKKAIHVTYEPCLYESIPQPENPLKRDYVLHLASREPHKRTEWLVNQWLDPKNPGLPVLHLVGKAPDSIRKRIADSEKIVMMPFLDDIELQAQFMGARALMFPSEIEGFGLPAIEAYYLGTPVCFVKGTSVDEVIGVATDIGGFELDDVKSMLSALDTVTAIPPDEVRRIGTKLRETYAASKVADRMCEVFMRAGASHGIPPSAAGAPKKVARPCRGRKGSATSPRAQR